MRFFIAFMVVVSLSANADFNQHATTIISASEFVGVDPVLMLSMAHKETRFRNVRAKAGGTAEGLFQITDRTWWHLLRRYANEYVIALDSDKYNPWANSVMAAAYVKENVSYLRKTLGREPTPGEVYMAHLLGLRGATTLFKADLDAKAHKVVSYAYERNSPLFITKNGKYRTVRQFRDYMNWRFNRIMQTYEGHYSQNLMAGL